MNTNQTPAGLSVAGGSAPVLTSEEVRLISQAIRAVDEHGNSGLCCEGRHYTVASRLDDRGLLRYIGEAEVVDDDGHMLGDCAACFVATEAGRAALPNNSGQT